MIQLNILDKKGQKNSQEHISNQIGKEGQLEKGKL